MPSLYRSRMHRPLLWLSHASLALVLVATVGLLVDDRTMVGAAIWWKPWKFAVSFWLYGLTLAWLIPKLTRAPRAAWWAGTIVTFAAGAELALITLQVIRGTRSHFNFETTFDTVVWQSMGATIMVLWIATAYIGLMLLRQGLDDRVSTSALRLGLAIALVGMALGFLMTSPTPDQMDTLNAGLESATIGAHSVGVPDGGGCRSPVGAPPAVTFASPTSSGCTPCS